MISNIYVNLPVKNLTKSMTFFKKIGFTFNAQFTDKSAACLVIGKNIYVMLITEERFRDFAKQKVSNAKKQTEVLLAIQVGDKKEVDTIVKKVLAAGGKTYRKPEDYGWMYIKTFADIDGHKWEVFCMDTKKMPKA